MQMPRLLLEAAKLPFVWKYDGQLIFLESKLVLRAATVCSVVWWGFLGGLQGRQAGVFL